MRAELIDLVEITVSVTKNLQFWHHVAFRVTVDEMGTPETVFSIH
jgi:hypothetical protein